MDCSFENPFYAGDEFYFMRINPNYTVVTKSYCIKVELPVGPLFGLFNMFSSEELFEMKIKCEERITDLFNLKNQVDTIQQRIYEQINDKCTIGQDYIDLIGVKSGRYGLSVGQQF